MTPALKSYGFSLIVHGTFLAVLYVMPAATQRQFTPQGQTQVIAIEATQIHASTESFESTVSVTVKSTPLASLLDSDMDRFVSAELSRDLLAIDPLDLPESNRRELPKLRSPRRTPRVQMDHQLAMQRREFEPPKPEVHDTDEPPRPRTPRPRTPRPITPPAGAPALMQEFVGLKESEPADMSENRPPTYPMEAVRRQLEGVVLLELTIDVFGDVTRVDVVESSGQQVLDQAAVDAVMTWKGKPAERWGRPVESVERLPVRFRL